MSARQEEAEHQHSADQVEEVEPVIKADPEEDQPMLCDQKEEELSESVNYEHQLLTANLELQTMQSRIQEMLAGH